MGGDDGPTPISGLEGSQADGGVLRFQLQQRGACCQALCRLVDLLEPIDDILQLIREPVELGARVLILLLHGGHGCGDLLLNHRRLLPRRQIAFAHRQIEPKDRNYSGGVHHDLNRIYQFIGSGEEIEALDTNCYEP